MRSDGSVGVSVQVFGGLRKEEHSFTADFPQGTTRRQAVDLVKQNLSERGLTSPFQIYLNNKYALGIADGEAPITENDIFKILPIMGGG